MILEEAATEDALEILALQKAAYATEKALYPEEYIEPMRTTLEEQLETMTLCEVYVVRKDHRIVGSINIRVDGEVGYIGKVIVLPELHGQGIGSFMLDEIERLYAHLHTFELFTAYRSARNIAIYEHKGYVQYKTEMLKDDFGFVFLQKVVEN